MSQHTWISEVLKDLELYSKKNNIHDLNEAVSDLLEKWRRSPESRNQFFADTHREYLSQR